MRVLITRPRDDAERLAEALSPMGIEPLLEPLFHIDHTGGPKLDLDGVQALLVTSANGVRAFAARDRRRDLTVYAVGDASAQAAAEAGFADVESASGDVEDLAHLVRRRLDPARGAVFHAAGTTVAGDLAGMVEEAGFTYRRAVLYEARAADGFSAATVQALKAGTVDGALFFSPRTAACFVDLVRKGAADATQVHPLDPLADLIKDFLARGGTLWACTPCVKARAYDEDDLIEGTVITGAAPMHALIKDGAATLSF